MKPQFLILFLVFLIPAIVGAAEEILSDDDKAEIMKVVCEGKLIKDNQGFVCKQDSESLENPWLAELRWSTAMRGKWFKAENEWLVSLHGFCHHGCVGVSFVVKKAKDGWTKLVQTKGLLSEECVRIRRMADGFDRVACIGAAGPHQGGMTEWLEVFGYTSEEFSTRLLLYKEQGGECWIAHPPQKAEYQGDTLSGFKAGPLDSDLAFTIWLQIRRFENCDSTVEDPDKLAKVKGEYLLKFFKRANEIIPDEETKRIIQETGWTPE